MEQLKHLTVRKPLVVLILGVLVTIAAGVALATPPLFFSPTQHARGTSQGPFKVKLQDSSSAADAAIVQITQAVGGHSGWHSHPGPAIVIVKSGELTIQQAKDCSSATYTAGQVAIEPAGHVHIARNTGTGPMEIWVAFLDVPVGAQTRIDESDPAC